MSAPAPIHLYVRHVIAMCAPPRHRRRPAAAVVLAALAVLAACTGGEPATESAPAPVSAPTAARTAAPAPTSSPSPRATPRAVDPTTPIVLPVVTIAAVSPVVAEGSPAKFTVSRTGDTAAALTVPVSVSETGSTFSGTPPASATITAGRRHVVLDIATEDDKVREDGSAITAAPGAGGGYAVGAPASAEVTVEDDETPATALRYDTYDVTGDVVEPGSYAFLTETGDGNGPSLAVVTTYEGIREDATMLRMHLRDAGGVTRAALYDAVEAGDIFEWYRADDCFTRYQVTSAPAPAVGAAYREFGVAWMTYAFTGCSGALAAVGADLDFGDLPDLGGPSLTAPVVHGIYQIVPAEWRGPTAEPGLDFGGPGPA